MKEILKLTVNTGQVMLSGKIYYYLPLNSVAKSLIKHRFSLHNLLPLCIVGISRWQKSKMSVFKAKKVKVCIFYF